MFGNNFLRPPMLIYGHAPLWVSGSKGQNSDFVKYGYIIYHTNRNFILNKFCENLIMKINYSRVISQNANVIDISDVRF